jgi:hypothetical protein
MVDSADDFDAGDWGRLGSSLGDRLRALVPAGWRPEASTVGLLLAAFYGFFAAASLMRLDNLLNQLTALFAQGTHVAPRLAVDYGIEAVSRLVVVAAEVVIAGAGVAMLARREGARLAALAGLAVLTLAVATEAVDGLVNGAFAFGGIRVALGDVFNVCAPLAVLAVVAWSRRQV